MWANDTNFVLLDFDRVHQRAIHVMLGGANRTLGSPRVGYRIGLFVTQTINLTAELRYLKR